MRVEVKVKIKNVPEIKDDFINVPDSATTQEIDGFVSDYVHRQYTRVETFYHAVIILRRQQ